MKPRTWLSCALLLALSAPAAAFRINIDSLLEGAEKLQLATGNVPREKEIQIGEQLSAGLLGAVDLVDDADVQAYVNRVGRWVADQSERDSDKWPWRFGVLDTDSVNAFAAPGCHVFVTRGLLTLLRNEAELAGVLAHEIVHVLHKHHLQALQQGSQGELLQLALEQVSEDRYGEAVDKLVGAGLKLYARGLERDDEFDADLGAVVLTARAGYDPFALFNVLATIDSLNPDDPDAALMFATHPPTAARIERLDQQVGNALDKYATQVQAPERFVPYRDRLLP